MKYIQHVNTLIGKKTSETEGLVLFGQNIAAGSHLSGLTKGLRVGRNGRIINTPNSENTLTALGFGMMLRGVSSIFFVKQLDFLLLGVDHLVNTYNFIRRHSPHSSYTIVPIISDLGYHGLQSSFNNFGDLCSIARIPGFTINNKVDAEAIIGKYLVSPGFRIIAVGQRLFGRELEDITAVRANEEQTIFQYTEGEAATIACFNLSYAYGETLHRTLAEKGVSSELFSVDSAVPVDWSLLIESTKKTGTLIVIDDSKGMNRASDNLIVGVGAISTSVRVIELRRTFTDSSWLYPNPDELLIDYDTVAASL